MQERLDKALDIQKQCVQLNKTGVPMLQAEEISLHRQDASKLKAYYQDVHKNIEDEREKLMIELNCVKDRLNASEDFYKEMESTSITEADILRKSSKKC